MRSPADARAGGRAPLEAALRVAAVALLAAALWLELRPASGAGPVAARATASTVADSLARWTLESGAERVHVALDGVPADTVRDWLRALRGGGVQVGWSSPPLPALAVAAEAVADPAAPVRLLAAAPAGGEVAFADGAGPLGTSVAGGAGASAVAGTVAGAVRATAGPVTAAAPAPAPPVLRPVLLLGHAGWEAKFVALALEERGWKVVARLAVAPGVSVSQGDPGAIDTATVAAVVALDSTAAPRAGAIARYVRAGGGLVLGQEAAALRAFAPLAAGPLAAPDRDDADLLASAEPRRGLPLRPVAARGDAVPLERRGERVAVAARRVGAGRVVQLGYAETWRWRMAGADGAPEAHRAWWSGLVAAAAYAPAAAPAIAPPDAPAALDDAPVARLIAALGPPAPGAAEAAGAGPRRERGAPPWIFPLVALLLLAEWASRRTRGVR